MFLAAVEDLYSRRMLGFATSDGYPTAGLATAALQMAAATIPVSAVLTDAVSGRWRAQV